MDPLYASSILTNLLAIVFSFYLLFRFFEISFLNPIVKISFSTLDPFCKPFRVFLPILFGIDLACVFWIIDLKFLSFYLFSSSKEMDFDIINAVSWSILSLFFLVSQILRFSLFISIIGSWVAPTSNNPFLSICHNITQPLLKPFQRLTLFGGMDFSPIIVFFLFKKKIHWSVWPSVLLCVVGGYFLTNFQDATVRIGDTLVVICALFWALHIIFIGIIIKEFNAPILVGLVQTFIVSICSLIPALIFEEFIWSNILSQKIQILYAGILSGGIAFVLQIYAQQNIAPAPSAIIFSLEGVFATVAAWIILSQILNINNIIGCCFILAGVLISQLLPEFKKA